MENSKDRCVPSYVGLVWPFRKRYVDGPLAVPSKPSTVSVSVATHYVQGNLKSDLVHVSGLDLVQLIASILCCIGQLSFLANTEPKNYSRFSGSENHLNKQKDRKRPPEGTKITSQNRITVSIDVNLLIYIEHFLNILFMNTLT